MHEVLQDGSHSDKRVDEVNVSDTLHDDEFFLGKLTELAAVQRGAGDSWKAKVKLNGKPAEFKVNIGAPVTVIPSSVYYSIVKQDNQVANGFL